MYITKSNPNTIKNGRIKAFIEISDGVLIINDRYKYQDGKWFYYGDDGKWYFLGYGANPAIVDDGKNVINQELYDAVFEKIEE